MTVAEIALTVIILFGAVVIVGMRRWALRVEYGQQALEDKVHRLQRGSIFAMLSAILIPSVVLPVIAAINRRSPHPPGHSGRAVVALVPLMTLLLYLVLLIGISKTVRPSLVRVRGIEAKAPGKIRAVLVFMLFGAAFAGLYASIRALVPGSGTGHAVGIVGAYLGSLLLAHALLAPLWLVALRAHALEREQHDRLLALADRLGVRVRDSRLSRGAARNSRMRCRWGYSRDCGTCWSRTICSTG